MNVRELWSWRKRLQFLLWRKTERNSLRKTSSTDVYFCPIKRIWLQFKQFMECKLHSFMTLNPHWFIMTCFFSQQIYHCSCSLHLCFHSLNVFFIICLIVDLPCLFLVLRSSMRYVCVIHSQSITDCSCALDVSINHRFIPLGIHSEFGEESVWRGKWCVPWRRMGTICWIIHWGLKHSRVCRIRGHPHPSRDKGEASCEPCCVLLEHCKNLRSLAYIQL